ncbi:MAG TPA: HPr family phosphocarrier protein [Candidatus Binatia bacterium]|jgi:phosphocarrier protein HPr|nr:HPr family phosphocarrier protein [Candidatus Binatia bacterium]
MEPVAKTLEIKNKLGLHARAAALLVQTINKFDAEVTIAKDGQSVDGRSIMGVLTLAATQGSTIYVEAKGREAESVLAAVEKLIDQKFHEND